MRDGLREMLGAVCQGRTLYMLLGTGDWTDGGKTSLIAFNLDA